MPPVPVVDAHVHLWDPQQLRIPWLDTSDLLNRPYGLAEYRAHTVGLEVAAMVYVQVEAARAYSLTEASLVAAMAVAEPRLKAIVAYAPLEDGLRARSYLADLVRISPLIKGVRRITQGEADPSFCLRPDFVAGVRLLAEYGLSCDLCIAPHQLGPAIELVRSCPEVSFMLDHLASPPLGTEAMEAWRVQMAELAGLPNVCCKVSGVVTVANHEAWQISDIAPAIEHALRVFGEDRVAYGSDWPVVLRAASYQRWAEALAAVTDQLSQEAQLKLWAANGARFYRFEAP